MQASFSVFQAVCNTRRIHADDEGSREDGRKSRQRYTPNLYCLLLLHFPLLLLLLLLLTIRSIRTSTVLSRLLFKHNRQFYILEMQIGTDFVDYPL